MQTAKQLILQAQLIRSDKHREIWVKGLEPAEVELLQNELNKLAARIKCVWAAITKSNEGD